jgi:hypothetical protein
MDTTTIALIACCFIGAAGLGIMYFLAVRGMPPADPPPPTKAQLLEQAQRDFGNPWGAHG